MKFPGRMLSFVLKMLVSKPATVNYPVEKAEMPENFRGKLVFAKDKCIGCKLCMKDCPSNAIYIEKTEGEEKKFKASVCLDKCIYCGQCVDSCPKDALKCTKEFELAHFDRDKLKVDI